MKKLLFLLLVIPFLISASPLQQKHLAVIAALNAVCAGGADGAMGGSDTASDSNCGLVEGDCAMSPFTPSEDGTVTYIHSRMSLNTGTYRAAIYDSNRTTVLGYGSIESGTDYDAALNTAVCLGSGVTYYLAVCGDGDDNFCHYYVTSGTIEIYNCNTDTWAGGEMPADLSGCINTWRTDKLIDMWVDNTP